MKEFIITKRSEIVETFQVAANDSKNAITIAKSGTVTPQTVKTKDPVYQADLLVKTKPLEEMTREEKIEAVFDQICESYNGEGHHELVSELMDVFSGVIKIRPITEYSNEELDEELGEDYKMEVENEV